jgi:glyoxylase-like metal-dependent hydrolase (beta-lactamase superfamily II)
VPGGWTVTRNDVAPTHTFTASEDGWFVNSHVIEFPSQLFVIDAQYTLPNAREVVRYARGLRKPMTRLIVTHYHPDHILGAAAFDAPLYTLESVAEKIGAAGDRVAQEEREKVGDDIPGTARRPDRRVAEGAEILDGVRLELRRLNGAETEDALTIALPDAGAIIVQDLVYHHAHPFLAERRFNNWREALRAYQALPYEVVLPGHGLPGGKALYEGMLRYLDVAEEALHVTRSPSKFREHMIDRFPNYGGLKVLDHQLRFLFPETAHEQPWSLLRICERNVGDDRYCAVRATQYRDPDGDKCPIPGAHRSREPSRPRGRSADGVAIARYVVRRKDSYTDEGNWAGFWGADVVMQHFAELYAGTFVMAPHYDRVKTVGLTADVAETYAPLDISVSYAGQTATPKPFLMIVTWVRTPDAWKMATDVALPIPPAPARKS